MVVQSERELVMKKCEGVGLTSRNGACRKTNVH